MKKILNLKQMIMLEFKSAKLFSLKDMLLIGMKTFLLGKKICDYWFKLCEVFMKKNCIRLLKKNLELKK